jgi:predicted extracellular nuclease
VPLFVFLLILVLLTPPAGAAHSSLAYPIISEVQISGASAADEFIELYNPTDCPIDLDGWKLTKKTSGGVESNLVASLSGVIPAHGFFLITPQSGYTGAVAADQTYSGASFAIAANNTVLLYADQDKIERIDKVGFGSAADSEGLPTTNPPAFGSIARTTYSDTDNNAADFSVREVSEPNNTNDLDGVPGVCELPPPSPPETPPPSVPSEIVITIRAARESSMGSTVTVEGMVTAAPGQLSASSFYMEDSSGGMQIYSSKKAFPSLELGDKIRVRGDTSEAYNERRLKIVAASDIQVVGKGLVRPRRRQTGAISEPDEGVFVVMQGTVTQTSGATFFIDDGSGERKIYIRGETAIDKPRMRRGDQVTVSGIVSQYKDEYRVLPRAQNDLSVGQAEEAAEEQDEEAAGAVIGESDPAAFVVFTKTKQATPNNSTPPGLDRVARASIIFGVVLLALVPLLIWEKRSGFLRAMLTRRGSSSGSLPPP